jgi:hypothetical protein
MHRQMTGSKLVGRPGLSRPPFACHKERLAAAIPFRQPVAFLVEASSGWSRRMRSET